MDIKYDDAISLISEGDILFFKGYNFVIRMVGRSRYTHVALASKRNGHIECVEFRGFRGGRIINLATQFPRFSGRIDVYRTATEIVYCVEKDGQPNRIMYDGRKVTNYLRDLAGKPYGWREIERMSLFYIPFIRWFVRPDENDVDVDGFNPVCSTSISAALRHNFVDPVPNLADFDTMPGDLARSAIFTYLFTLV